MGCFSWATIEHLAVWLVVVCAVLAIIRVVLARVSPPAEFAWLVSMLAEIIRIILWAVIIIAIIVMVFALLACAVPLR